MGNFNSKKEEEDLKVSEDEEKEFDKFVLAMKKKKIWKHKLNMPIDISPIPTIYENLGGGDTLTRMDDFSQLRTKRHAYMQTCIATNPIYFKLPNVFVNVDFAINRFSFFCWGIVAYSRCILSPLSGSNTANSLYPLRYDTDGNSYAGTSVIQLTADCVSMDKQDAPCFKYNIDNSNKPGSLLWMQITLDSTKKIGFTMQDQNGTIISPMPTNAKPFIEIIFRDHAYNLY